jgi:hypothetical protein
MFREEESTIEARRSPVVCVIVNARWSAIFPVEIGTTHACGDSAPEFIGQWICHRDWRKKSASALACVNG